MEVKDATEISRNLRENHRTTSAGREREGSQESQNFWGDDEGKVGLISPNLFFLFSVAYGFNLEVAQLNEPSSQANATKHFCYKISSA